MVPLSTAPKIRGGSAYLRLLLTQAKTFMNLYQRLMSSGWKNPIVNTEHATLLYTLLSELA
ncbi:hypothetical protein QC763_0010720 [Podospora pseudopauciseta]|uniref:Uncharacterized protein n=2 Tax=Podospora TaxID=5144 RepID=A0ABR0HYT0_9PEZI|nr:hypothetical protein QC763_0010720 [Podospora pseudopauciseta]KAK4681612.1 hypothetical protein QC764_0010780 [Podospora pseudoanserina]